MPSLAIKQAKLEYEAGRQTLSLKKHNKRKNVPVSAFINKVVAMDDNPIVIDLSTGMLPRTVRATSGFFTLTYNPENSPKHVKNKPYTVGQDLIAARISVSGPAHFKKLAERIPELGWIRRWSYLTDDLWAVAKKHPGIAFGFNVNWPAYAAMIEAKAEQMGIDIDHKPFLAYITTAEKMKQLREKYKMYPKPTKEDYQTVLDEVDKEVKVHG